MRMIHKGSVLTEEQKRVLEQQPVEILELSPRNFRKAVDIALKNAGVPVPDIEPGQVISWAHRGEIDNGALVSYDERADKYRVTSTKLKRDVTVAGGDIRVCLHETWLGHSGTGAVFCAACNEPHP